jgi:hypothetical protein
VVALAADAHVVGHEVQHQAHAVLAQGGRQLSQTLVTAEFSVDRSVVDDVVAMGAARPGLKDRRRVQRTDPQA